MASHLRAHRHDTYNRVAAFLESFDDAWWMATAGFARSHTVTAERRRWTVAYRIDAYHVNRYLAREPRLMASITLWPPARNERATRVYRRNGTPREKQWIEACERQIRRQGYRGQWRKSPWGEFGDFSKRLKDAKAVAAEVKRLGALEWEL